MLWNVEEGNLKRIFPDGFDWVFQASGDLIAVATTNDSVEIASSATGIALRDFYGHTDPIYGMWFSPKGDHLAPAAYDGTVRLFSTA